MGTKGGSCIGGIARLGDRGLKGSIGLRVECGGNWMVMSRSDESGMRCGCVGVCVGEEVVLMWGMGADGEGGKGHAKGYVVKVGNANIKNTCRMAPARQTFSFGWVG